ncbi:hypothetical protein [Thalassotalea sp. PLHSN55]|uniref:hypothetical protein n=1 Tax=Thalassotalea sp. PLHSN55 TaxID=3435888 RepID=UPI003F877E3A
MVTKAIKIIALSLVALNAQANQSESQDWQIHGFLAQGLIDVSGSDFVNDDGDLSAELTEVGVNGSYQLFDSIRLAGQAVYLNGGNRYEQGLRLDYALIDWSVYNDENWLVNLYLGRFKNNHWLHSSTRDIPHARPSIILPQGLYFDGFRDIAMGGDGAALKVSYNFEDWGDIDFNVSSGKTKVSTDAGKLLLGDDVDGDMNQESDFQTSVFWQPAYSPWRFGVSFLDSEFSFTREEQNDTLLPATPSVEFYDGVFSFKQYTGYVVYEGENWEFTAEALQQTFTTEGFYPDALYEFLGVDQIEKVGQGIYFQSRYKYNDRLSLMARVERFYADKDDKDGSQLEAESGGLVPSYFGFQHDIVLGAHYDIADSLRVQMEYHWVEGTARLTPVVSPNAMINSNKNWNLFAVQLMYWF